MVFGILQGPTDIIKNLPLKNYGFEWLIPVVIVAIICTIIASICHKKRAIEN